MTKKNCSIGQRPQTKMLMAMSKHGATLLWLLNIENGLKAPNCWIQTELWCKFQLIQTIKMILKRIAVSANTTNKIADVNAKTWSNIAVIVEDREWFESTKFFHSNWALM
jgi:hypothetical protein